MSSWMKHIYGLKVWYDDKEYTANVNVEVEVDNNYGADADGNRGTSRTFTDVDIEDVRDENGKEIQYKDLSEGLREAIIDKANEEDLSPPEPDCEDDDDF